MPTYDYQCRCGQRMQIIVPMRSHQRTWPCSKCGADAEQIITQAPYTIIPEHMRWNAQGYESPTTGRTITTKKQRIEDMAASGCIEYDPGMRQDADRRSKEDEAALERSVSETLAREIEAMPAQKKQALEAELTRGADIGFTRI